MDFLTGSSSLPSIVRKYSRGLAEHYEAINVGIIEGVAEEQLRILSEIEAAERAVIILNAYVYRRFKFHRDNRPRRFSGLFSSQFKGVKGPYQIKKNFALGSRLSYSVSGLMYTIMRPVDGE